MTGFQLNYLMINGHIKRAEFQKKLVETALPKYLNEMGSNCLGYFDKSTQTFYFFKISNNFDINDLNMLKSINIAFPAYGSTKQDQADSNIKIG